MCVIWPLSYKWNWLTPLKAQLQTADSPVKNLYDASTTSLAKIITTNLGTAHCAKFVQLQKNQLGVVSRAHAPDECIRQHFCNVHMVWHTCVALTHLLKKNENK